MDEQDFMRRAIEIGRTSLDHPGTQPFGAVVVKDGRIVGEGLNHTVAHHDPTSHGETEAIRDACRKLGTYDLSGCELYTSCEPCSLCVSAMYLAGITKLYYAASLEESSAVLAAYETRAVHLLDVFALRAQVAKAIGQRSMPAVQIQSGPSLELIKSWADSVLPKAS